LLPRKDVPHPGHQQLPIKIAKSRLSSDGNTKPAEVFTMSLGEETIELLPFRNWGQLDVCKWSVRGKLPGTPAGLEVAADHVRIAGETVSLGDPDCCPKLEKAFNEWLVLENQNLEFARKKIQPKPPVAIIRSLTETPAQILHYRVTVDKSRQVHIACLRGAETLASAGLTVQGFSGLFSQGLMRKPRLLDVGALHDWVELDGELCSFEHGNNDAEKLEKLLNERYAPLEVLGAGKNILIFANAASPTGFDIQFPVSVGGVPENRRRALNDTALELLQDTARCGLLRPGLIIKLIPPTLVFKNKTPDGGEKYLEQSAEHTVSVLGDDGRERLIDLSHPVNYARLSVVEVTALFNHPAINRHTTPGSGTAKKCEAETRAVSAPLLSGESLVTAPFKLVQSAGEATVKAGPPSCDPEGRTPASPHSFARTDQGLVGPSPRIVASASSGLAPSKEFAPRPEAPHSAPQPPPSPSPPQEPISLPNAWLKDVLTRPSIRHDWFTRLVYGKIAERFGNSTEGVFGPSKCWSVALGETAEMAAPDFKGVFLTQKGGLGFLGHARLIKFHRGVVFLGTQNSVLEGINLNLVAVGLDEEDRFVFVVAEDYASKFDVPGQTLAQELARLNEAGASLLNVNEALQSRRPIRVVWTVPAEQPDPADPQALETMEANRGASVYP
jgi:hypothetical protein